MSKLSRGFVSGTNQRVLPLMDGRVPVEGAELVATRSDPSETFRTRGADPYSYGVAANRPMLQTLIDYSHEQGLIQEKPKLEDDLFAPSTLEL